MDIAKKYCSKCNVEKNIDVFEGFRQCDKCRATRRNYYARNKGPINEKKMKELNTLDYAKNVIERLDTKIGRRIFITYNIQIQN